MELTIQTPALLFPAISFLVLAYTNRYSALTRLARELLREHAHTPADYLVQQITMLRGRIRIIKVMLTGAAVSMAASVLSVLLLFEELEAAAKWAFMGSLVLLTATYALAVVEIFQSSRALDVQMEATLRS
jgi:hypothetical protein